MTAFVLSANTNIDALTVKAGGDTYDTNGWVLTIDQDSRSGLNSNTSATLGNITVNASKGGAINIDGRDIWMIPYTEGSGTVPAYNTVITRSTGSGKLIGVHSSLATAVTAPGAAMPATGFIRVKQKSGSYSAGVLTGITATASDAGRVGWIEVVGDESATINANRLGSVNITGAWFSVGTTTGGALSIQLPNNGLFRYCPGVFIEKTAGQADYEFWPNAGTTTTTGTTVATANDSIRGKVCWINSAGLISIGNSGGTGLNGYIPPTGLAIVVGNVFLENAATAARTANVIPNATIATRYDFTCTGGGVVNIDKASCAWYGSFSQAYSVSLTNAGFTDAILLSEIATPMTLIKVGVGNKATTALLVSPLTLSLCFAGGTFTDCVWSRVSQATSGSHTVTLTDIYGFNFVRNTTRANTIRANATTFSINATRANNCSWDTPTIIQGAMTFTTCNNITVTNTVYCGAVVGTTVATYTGSVWTVASNTLNTTISGLTIPVTNTQPYTCLMQINAAGCDNIKLRNIASIGSRLNLGSSNATGVIYAIAAAAAATNIKVQRVYCQNTRSGVMTADNSSSGILEEHVFGDYVDTSDVMAALNFTRKASGVTGSLNAQTAVYGTHWRDSFPRDTTGRIAILMNEPTALTQAQVTLSNGAAFTAVGGLYMPVINQQAIFETPYYVQCHTGFTNTPIIMAGGINDNYTYQYQIDLNNGSGYSTWTSDLDVSTLVASLSAETINAAIGFKLRIKVRTITTNTLAITSIYFVTTSTTTSQDYLYPLDTNTVSFKGLPEACDVVVLTAGTTTIIGQADSVAGGEYAFTYSGVQNIDVGFIKQGYVPLYVRNLSLTLSDSSIPISMVLDRNYI